MVIKVKKNQGFTLIELMISTSLLMLIMFSGYYAYGLYTNNWQKRTDIFWQQTQSALAFDSINRLIESTRPYIIKADNNLPAIYFQASKEKVLFVSHSGIFTDRLAIVELKVESKNNESSIIYRESSLEGYLLLEQSDIIEWQHEVILLDNINTASFSYFGWQNLDELLSNNELDDKGSSGNTDDEIKPIWYTNHQLEKYRILPNKVNLYIKHHNNTETNLELMLPENSHRALIKYLREDI